MQQQCPLLGDGDFCAPAQATSTHIVLPHVLPPCLPVPCSPYIPFAFFMQILLSIIICYITYIFLYRDRFTWCSENKSLLQKKHI